MGSDEHAPEPLRRERFTVPPVRHGGRAAEAALLAEQKRRRWMGVSAVLGFLLVVSVTVMVIVEVVGGGDGDSAADLATAGEDDLTADGSPDGGAGGGADGPVPGTPSGDHVGALPAGPDVTRAGKDSWHGVGTPGTVAGHRDAHRTWTYVVEVEDGVDTATFAGGDAFARTVDTTLSDPRSWIADGSTAFRHISVTGSSGVPDLRIRLTSPTTTAQLCGSEIELETSCFLASEAAGGAGSAAGEGTVIINLARWVRGALPFAGDLGSYRQYVVNHEVGHGIGYARHQPCPSDGALAPVMMQQTLSLSNRDLARLDGEDGSYPDKEGTCRANAWPHPEGSSH
jgi:hypothetical protein